MKNFYLLRHEDVHGHSGLGVVAEGTIFDNGMVAMTWLSKWDTVTMFKSIQAVNDLHSHEGRTEIIVEGRRGHINKFAKCRELAREKKSAMKFEAEKEAA